MLFFVGEDARLWTHWNSSSDMHLSFLGPVYCVFIFGVLSGLTSSLWLVVQSLMTVTSFVYWYSKKCSISHKHMLLDGMFWGRYNVNISGVSLSPKMHHLYPIRKIKQTEVIVCRISLYNTPCLYFCKVSRSWKTKRVRNCSRFKETEEIQ